MVLVSWRTDEHRGIIAFVISSSCLAYYFNRLRPRVSPLPSTLILLPLIALAVFVLSLALGLRHPPFLVPEGWEWPPFATIEERAIHAFALSIWTFIFGTPTVVLLGTVRRLLVSSLLASKTGTKNPMTEATDRVVEEYNKS